MEARVDRKWGIHERGIILEGVVDGVEGRGLKPWYASVVLWWSRLELTGHVRSLVIVVGSATSVKRGCGWMGKGECMNGRKSGEEK